MCKKVIASEFVSCGHPDKIADQISDNVLDKYLAVDPRTRAGIEVLVKDNIVVLGGEINASARINYEDAVREVFADLKFPEHHHLSPDEIKVLNLIGKQSTEIHSGVDKSETVIGAGDQGFVVGFASNETNTLMPLGHHIAKMICQKVASSSEHKLGPDAKSQVVVEYDGDTATVKSILVSTMHQCDLRTARETVEKIIRSNLMGLDNDLFNKHIAKNTELLIEVNPCGEWKTGGSVSDCGVTGRKIVVDQFGGYANVGGGNLGGKDFTKVDRSAAYMARYIAKNIVASGIADTAKVELSYMIGVPEPSSINIELNRNGFAIEDIKQWIFDNIDLTPYGIFKRLEGDTPRYYSVNKFGHYGQCADTTPPSELFPWEKTDLADRMREEIVVCPF